MLRKLLMVSGGAVLGFLACEVGLRIAGIHHPVFFTFDAARGIAPLAGAAGWNEREGKAFVRINSMGFRDVEQSLEKPADALRIAFIGDSYTEAQQVALEDTYWKRVERLLSEHMEAGRVQSLGFGVGGYGTTQELLTYRLDASRYDPDVVVLVMYLGNDLADNSRRASESVGLSTFRPFYVYQNGELVLDESFRKRSLGYYKQRFVMWATSTSRVFEILNQFRRGINTSELRRELADERQSGLAVGLLGAKLLHREPKRPVLIEAWAVTEAMLIKMNAEVTESGARFAVVTTSIHYQVDPDPVARKALLEKLGVEDLFYAEKRLLALGEEHGFDVITLGPRMQSEAEARQVYFHGFENLGMGQGHWNMAGHELAAEILVEEFLNRDLLGER